MSWYFSLASFNTLSLFCIFSVFIITSWSCLFGVLNAFRIWMDISFLTLANFAVILLKKNMFYSFRVRFSLFSAYCSWTWYFRIFPMGIFSIFSSSCCLIVPVFHLVFRSGILCLSWPICCRGCPWHFSRFLVFFWCFR